jgi:hypothetical protein
MVKDLMMTCTFYIKLPKTVENGKVTNDGEGNGYFNKMLEIILTNNTPMVMAEWVCNVYINARKWYT